MHTVVRLFPLLLVLLGWITAVAVVIRNILCRRRRVDRIAPDEKGRLSAQKLGLLGMARHLVIFFWLVVMSLTWAFGYVEISQWVVTLWMSAICGLGLIGLGRVERWVLYDLRRDAGCCVRCGYDLRASKDQCPECGAPRAPAVAPMRNRTIKPWW